MKKETRSLAFDLNSVTFRFRNVNIDLFLFIIFRNSKCKLGESKADTLSLVLSLFKNISREALPKIEAKVYFGIYFAQEFEGFPP